ncbi:murein biosynthesis integral membrane protein MurJ [Desulfotomaculum copahuensis]|uniref:Probable lipid II flippase MurJ n=1 Tax=Desulfotomaculum copahuensis TaxID=1838280 RepID=A0A1B7LCC8_9FIRM|nr:murein biosynthesis integral membrane protein MurJ [Desulfotomaculum copahuensis]OAT80346.1 murein biosynthesis integral membrane protein MurJ [Desulfotomaculum copahuensis]
MIDRKQIARAALVVMVALLISKIMGYAREAALASGFGAGASTDAYLVAVIVPALLFGMVGSAITTVAIPIFSEYLHQPEKRPELPDLIWTTFHAVTGILLLFALAGFPAAPFIVRLLAPGFGPAEARLTAHLVRIMLPMVVLMGLAGWAQGVLNAHRHFTAPALIGIPYNLIMIGGIIFSAVHRSIDGVAWSMVLATLSQFLTQLPALYRLRTGYRPVCKLRHPALKRMLLLSGPVLVGTGANQLNLVVDRILASGLVVGSISALNYAQRVVTIPQGLLATPLITVLYPSLTEHTAVDDPAGFRSTLKHGMNMLAFLLIPLTAGIIVLRHDIIRFLFERGAFDARAAEMTAVALCFFIPGLLFLCWRDYLNRAFYALQDTVTPMWTGAAGVVVNIGLNLLLVRHLALAGLALSTSAAAAVCTILLLVFLRRRLGHIGGRALLAECARITLASLVMGAALWWLNTYALNTPVWTAVSGLVRGAAGAGGLARFLDSGLRLGVLTAAGLLIFAPACRLLRVVELDYLLDMLKGAVRRLRLKTAA